MAALKQDLPKWGWSSVGTEPLKLTLDAAAYGIASALAAEDLRVEEDVELEYADRDFVVLMASGATEEADFQAVERALRLTHRRRPRSRPALPLAKGERVLSVREALFARQETVPAEESLGRICGAPTVSCPPAVPIAVSGERIGPAAVALFRYYGVETVDVLRT